MGCGYPAGCFLRGSRGIRQGSELCAAAIPTCSCHASALGLTQGLASGLSASVPARCLWLWSHSVQGARGQRLCAGAQGGALGRCPWEFLQPWLPALGCSLPSFSPDTRCLSSTQKAPAFLCSAQSLLFPK